jgi:hypothetical protein
MIRSLALTNARPPCEQPASNVICKARPRETPRRGESARQVAHIRPTGVGSLNYSERVQKAWDSLFASGENASAEPGFSRPRRFRQSLQPSLKRMRRASGRPSTVSGWRSLTWEVWSGWKNRTLSLMIYEGAAEANHSVIVLYQ